VAQSGRRSEVDVERLQITLSAEVVEILDRIVKISRFGRNRNEVAARLVSDWLYDKSPEFLEGHFKRIDALKRFDALLEKDAEDAQ
jgi:hypothetical protein